MLDRREEILNSHFDLKDRSSEQWKIFNAMDEHFTERAMELLEYMAKNSVDCDNLGAGPIYYFKGEWITKEQLFQNFL